LHFRMEAARCPSFACRRRRPSEAVGSWIWTAGHSRTATARRASARSSTPPTGIVVTRRSPYRTAGEREPDRRVISNDGNLGARRRGVRADDQPISPDAFGRICGPGIRRRQNAAVAERGAPKLLRNRRPPKPSAARASPTDHEDGERDAATERVRVRATAWRAGSSLREGARRRRTGKKLLRGLVRPASAPAPDRAWKGLKPIARNPLPSPPPTRGPGPTSHGPACGTSISTSNGYSGKLLRRLGRRALNSGQRRRGCVSNTHRD